MKLILALIFIFITVSCRIDTPGGNSNKPTLNELSIDTINFFFDDSGSMQGYYPNKTDFHKNISTIITQVDKNFSDSSSINYFTVSNDQKMYQKEEFEQKFLNSPHSLAGNKSTRIDLLFKYAFDRLSAADNNISILVTDGILSVEGSKDKLEDIGNMVDRIIADNKKYSLKGYAFYSQFMGEDFPYETNSKKKIKEIFDSRPYYIFYLGRPDVITKFERQLGELPEAQEMIIFNSNNNHSFKLSSCFDLPLKEANTKIVKDTFLRFNKEVGDFKFLCHIYIPSFCKTEKFKIFEGNSELSDYQITMFSNKDAVSKKYLATSCEYDERLFNSVLLIEINNYTPKLNKEVSIRYTNDWYQKWNSNDDDGISPDDNKTFGLEVLIRNIAEGYEGTKIKPEIYLYNWNIPIINNK